jgi:hypothetical protein
MHITEGIVVSDQEDIQCAVVIFCQLELFHLCGYVGFKGVGLGKGWGQQLVGNGAVDSQHGTRVEEVHPLH